MNKLDQIWEESFLSEIAEQEERSGTNPVDWRAGGRATKAYPDKENKAWWDENGKQMFFNFITNWRESGFKVWVTPEGVPGIELGFYNFFGEVPIKAYADLVIVTPQGELAVVDLKTGSHMPDSSLQLGIYASLMEMQFGVRPQIGFYYNARTATFEESHGLHRWTIPVLTELFTKFDQGVRAEIFLPNIGMACFTCGVKDYCYAQGGQLAQIYDPLASIK